MAWKYEHKVWEPISVNDPGAGGAFTYPTQLICPQNEFWEIYSMYIARSGGAALTVADLNIVDARTGTGQYLVQPTAAAAVLYSFLDRPLEVPPQFKLGIYIGGYGAGDTYSVSMYMRRWKNE